MSVQDFINDALDEKIQAETTTSALDIFDEAFEEKTEVVDDEITQYRKLLNDKYRKETNFDISTQYHKLSKAFKFTFYDDSNKKSNMVYVKDLTGKKRAFIKIFNTSEKKINELTSQKKKFEKLDYIFLSSFYFAMTLSAYMIKKFGNEEKEKIVDEFDLDINKLLEDDLFISLLEKFNKNNKDNYYDLLE
jgi:hypothetical protein